MKQMLTMIMVASLTLAAGAAAAAEIKSTRGDVALDAVSKVFGRHRVMTQEGGFKRAWKLQPPVIPHKIHKERISLDENSCFRCHSPDTYKAENAPMISKTHYADPQNPSDANLIRRRWFCTQCHVPQIEAKPPVENMFKSAGK